MRAVSEVGIVRLQAHMPSVSSLGPNMVSTLSSHILAHANWQQGTRKKGSASLWSLTSVCVVRGVAANCTPRAKLAAETCISCYFRHTFCKPLILLHTQDHFVWLLLRRAGSPERVVHTFFPGAFQCLADDRANWILHVVFVVFAQGFNSVANCVQHVHFARLLSGRTSAAWGAPCVASANQSTVHAPLL